MNISYIEPPRSKENQLLDVLYVISILMLILLEVIINNV